MEIIEFDNNSKSLFEKYAPKNIKEIIGSNKQVGLLVGWLNNYELNSAINIKQQRKKKAGKKTRKRAIKVKISDCDINDDKAILETDTALSKTIICNDDKDNIDEISNEEINIVENDFLSDTTEKKVKDKKNPNICSCALITGDHGTGKTAIVKAILNGLNYQIKTVNFAKASNIKSINDFVKNIYNECSAFRDGNPFEDDVSIIGIEVTGTSGRKSSKKQ